jgi:hypothetical protein
LAEKSFSFHSSTFLFTRCHTILKLALRFVKAFVRVRVTGRRSAGGHLHAKNHPLRAS